MVTVLHSARLFHPPPVRMQLVERRACTLPVTGGAYLAARRTTVSFIACQMTTAGDGTYCL